MAALERSHSEVVARRDGGPTPQRALLDGVAETAQIGAHVSEKQYVVFDFTGALVENAEVLSVGYQYADELSEQVSAVEQMLGWDSSGCRVVHFGRAAVWGAFKADDRWQTDWPALAAQLHRFQAALAAVGIESIKVYETAEFPPPYWYRDEGTGNPLAPRT
ncbi:Uncharacterised protein (plasmid) [Tsukamurella tyrosinosolvens]|uniref:Uncharacterized protein n=1 Tax=Tsukamurella tyrosinosolvens TaxID=57704 RepID=A0A1H4UV73_TSUTY|nr:hypothetical protein [Tsukamurella tyrosinosolvens]KXO98395.1 hypothetical protein AXK58_25315 [Tsukamurella tyrosinosolvens]SEC72626.1 hypothetical protein SAMN04489793_3050 [Tsukamurella tyrosinosolvens]VEH90861.1 Uncharacterised protein [Tsukamurella tyrosinosolvens]